MSILMWRVLCIAFAVLFVTCIVVLLVTNLTKNKYYHDYHDDELLKREKSANSINSIYLTSGETKRFIRKYVVCKTVYEKYVVCNFAGVFDQIKFFVVQFNKRKKVISVLDVTQNNVTSDSSKIIALKASCWHVNVVISSVDGKVINQNYIRPISILRLRLYAALQAVALFSLLVVIRHIFIEVLGFDFINHEIDYRYQYLNGIYNYIALGASFGLSVISYLLTMLSFRNKNSKSTNGGALEYEFV